MINSNTRFLGVDSTKVDLTKKKDSLNNAVGSYYTADEINSAALPVQTTYPVTNAALAGQKFFYLGTEWHYMTQAQIDSVGWTGLVSVGFPAPVVKIYNNDLVFGGVTYIASQPTPTFSSGVTITNVDILGIGNPIRYSTFSIGWGIGTISGELRNFGLLKNLEDFGTTASINLGSSGLSAVQINSVFTQLPPTTKTATIRVSGNPGSATCNPTIATSKGYTVVTA